MQHNKPSPDLMRTILEITLGLKTICDLLERKGIITLEEYENRLSIIKNDSEFIELYKIIEASESEIEAIDELKDNLEDLFKDFFGEKGDAQ